MVDRKALIDKILQMEFHFFEATRARALEACAADEAEFVRQRRAQFVPWGTFTLKSYLGDLERALKTGANPVEHKYNCMESAPSEACASPQIERIVARNVTWRAALNARYPRFMARGRELASTGDEQAEIAFDTYLRCELASYSPRTVGLLHADVEQMHRIGVNMCEEIYDALVKQYGYPSLAAAEAALAEEKPAASAPNR